MIQRDGDVVIQMLPNVQQVTIQPIITHAIQVGSLIYTDEYDISALKNRLALSEIFRAGRWGPARSGQDRRARIPTWPRAAMRACEE